MNNLSIFQCSGERRDEGGKELRSECAVSESERQEVQQLISELKLDRNQGFTQVRNMFIRIWFLYHIARWQKSRCI